VKKTADGLEASRHDGRGWRPDVEYVVEHEWGRGRHVPMVSPERVHRVPSVALKTG
jgi:hypothetical protein